MTSADFFEKKYLQNPDPWNFTGSTYECERYDATIAALGTGKYGRAFEPGCSIGELTRRLAQRCEHVEAMDISRTAIEQAKIRCSHFSNVVLSVGSLPAQIPVGEFELIVLSEIGYYFEEPTLKELSETLVSRLRLSGILLAVHWLGDSKDHVLSGDRVHEILRSLDDLKLEYSERQESFRLDRWVRV